MHFYEDKMTIFEQTKILCQRLDIVPAKSKGQNFLISAGVLQDIIKAADLKKEDLVLEIGSGFGILTEQLVSLVGRVIAVELDRKLFAWLKKRFSGAKSLELIEGDIVSLFHCFIVSLLNGHRYKVVANLPYQITSHVLRLLLEAENPPEEMVLMMQKEVAERICAKQGEMSVLSVAVQYYSQPSIISIVGKENFWPKPAVDSAIIKIKRQKARLPAPDAAGYGGQAKGKINEELFFKLVRVGFSSKRKMLKNNLRNIYKEEEVTGAMESVGLGLKVRAEDLGVEEWMKLYERLGKVGK